MYHGSNMYFISAANVRTNGKHVPWSDDRFARTAGIPVAVTGGPEPTVGPSQLWKGCPFVAMLNLLGHPLQTTPFLLTF